MQHYIGDGSALGPAELAILQEEQADETTGEIYRQQAQGRDIVPFKSTGRYTVHVHGTREDPAQEENDYISTLVSPDILDHSKTGDTGGRVLLPLDTETGRTVTIYLRDPRWELEHPGQPAKSGYAQAVSRLHADETLDAGETAVPDLPSWVDTYAFLDVAR